MPLTRSIARPLLAAVFIGGGIETLRNPGPRVEVTEPLTPTLADTLPVPEDTEQLVKVNACVQVGAGLLFALGWFPRLAAAALAGSLVPTTMAGHRFWEEQDPDRKRQQQTHFLKNVSLLGGLLLAMFDTEGDPSLRWRAKRAAGQVRRRTAAALPS